MGAAGKKKKGKSDADARSEECQQWVSEDSKPQFGKLQLLFKVEKHRDHIQKLETLLRMLDNDQVCGFLKST